MQYIYIYFLHFYNTNRNSYIEKICTKRVYEFLQYKENVK